MYKDGKQVNPDDNIQPRSTSGAAAGADKPTWSQSVPERIMNLESDISSIRDKIKGYEQVGRLVDINMYTFD